MLPSLNRLPAARWSLLALAGLLLPGVVPPSAARETAVLAGGCFWGVEAVYRHVKGVKSVVSGFAVPVVPADSASGSAQSDRGTYAEAVRIEYDPAVVTYDQLLAIFFSVAHDPTEVGRQGPDIGPEYRSVIFTAGDGDQAAARQALDKVRADGTFRRPVTTDILALKSFKVAEESHQNYVAKNPKSPYVVLNDAPKLQQLQRQFPALYKER